MSTVATMNMNFKRSAMTSFGTHVAIFLALYLAMLVGSGPSETNRSYEVVMLSPPPAAVDATSADSAPSKAIPVDQGLPIRKSALGSLAKLVNAGGIQKAKVAQSDSRPSSLSRLRADAM